MLEPKSITLLFADLFNMDEAEVFGWPLNTEMEFDCSRWAAADKNNQ